MNNDHNIPFKTIDWTVIPKIEYKGETGVAFWQTVQLQGLRIRIVEYSKGYMADHWCQKGHIVHCIECEFTSELKTGENFILTKGMTYVVSDDLRSHRSITENGVKVMIIDGGLFKTKVENTTTNFVKTDYEALGSGCIGNFAIFSTSMLGNP